MIFAIWKMFFILIAMLQLLKNHDSTKLHHLTPPPKKKILISTYNPSSKIHCKICKSQNFKKKEEWGVRGEEFSNFKLLYGPIIKFEKSNILKNRKIGLKICWIVTFAWNLAVTRLIFSKKINFTDNGWLCHGNSSADTVSTVSQS